MGEHIVDPGPGSGVVAVGEERPDGGPGFDEVLAHCGVAGRGEAVRRQPDGDAVGRGEEVDGLAVGPPLGVEQVEGERFAGVGAGVDRNSS